jgi:trans-aconitate 2-methyltransferase
MRVLDLGCGTGDLTAELHRRLGARETLGIDASPAMLAAARPAPGLSFRLGRIEEFHDPRPFDLVFSNAALQWVEGHRALLRRLVGLLAPGGQLAVQVPANHDTPGHRAAARVARRPPYRQALGEAVRRSPVLSPQAYAQALHRLGMRRQAVRLVVYPHLLASRDEVVEWVKGTLLTWYRDRLGEELYTRFLEDYRQELARHLPDERPFFFPFKRLLFWGALP